MKIAVTGKGGAGKTTVAAILARTLARDGHQVVAVDADPNPNLALALGLDDAAQSRLEGVVNVLLREKAAHRHDDRRPACEPPAERSVEELLAALAVTGPDGVRLIQTGLVERPADGCLCCGSHGTTRRVFGELDPAGRVVIADLEAGVNDLIWAVPRDGDTVLAVTEPYLKSLEVTRRALQVIRDLGVGRVLVIANRVAGEADTTHVRESLPGVEVVAVPDDPAIAAAERRGLAPLDTAPTSPAVGTVQALARRLLEQSA